MKEVGKFYGYSVYLNAICILYAHLVEFVIIWYVFPVLVVPRNIWQPLFGPLQMRH
jgi:hypothetical protein